MTNSNIDSAGNHIHTVRSFFTHKGKPLVVVILIDDPERGYIALEEEEGGFGNEVCPDSAGRPCLAWFGPGEQYLDAWAAQIAVADKSHNCE